MRRCAALKARGPPEATTAGKLSSRGTGLDGPGGTGYGCHECKAALLVNPYDPDSVAAAIGQALSMPLAERRERHDALFRVLSHNDIQHWADRFLAALERKPTALSQLEQMPSVES